MRVPSNTAPAAPESSPMTMSSRFSASGLASLLVIVKASPVLVLGSVISAVVEPVYNG